MNQYSMMIQWSEEDRSFLVTIPEFSDRNVRQIATNTIAQLQEQNHHNKE